MFQFLHLRYISLLIAIYRRKKKKSEIGRKNRVIQFHNPYFISIPIRITLRFKKKINFQKRRTIRNISCVSISAFSTTTLPVHRKFTSCVSIPPSISDTPLFTGNSFRPKVDRVISFRAIEVRSHHFDPRD